MNFKFNYNYPKSWLGLKIITSILLGIVYTIYVTQQQIFFKNIVTNYAKTLLANHADYTVDFAIDQINLFSSEIILKDLKLAPKKSSFQNWSWDCRSVVINFSWLRLIIKRKIAITITMSVLNLNTQYQHNKLAIAEHLSQLLLAPSPIPIELKSLTVQTGVLNIAAPEKNLKSKISWSSNSKIIANVLKSNIYLTAGRLSSTSQNYFDQLLGNLQINLPFDRPENLNINCEISLKSPCMDDQYFISAKWGQNAGVCKIKSLSGKFELAPINLQSKNQIWQADLKGAGDLSLLQKIKHLQLLPHVTGLCKIDLSVNIYRDNYNIAGNCIIQDIKIGDYLLLDQAFFTCHRNNYLWHGQVNLEKTDTANFFGKWHWHEQKNTGSFNLYNKNQIAIPVGLGWQIKPHDINLNLKLTNRLNQLILTGNYQFLINNSKTNLIKKSTGQLNYQNQQVDLSGNLIHADANQLITQDNFQASFNLLSSQLAKLTVIGSDQTKPYLYATSKPNHQLEVMLDLGLINKCLPSNLNYFMNGSGLLGLNFTFKDNQLVCNLKLTDGNLVLPQIYNVIKATTGQLSYNLVTNHLKIDQLEIALYQGSVHTSGALISNEHIYLPILFDNVVLNFERNLITNCSGKILYQHDPSKTSHLKGFVLLEQTLCRYNPLSPDLANLFGSNSANYFKPAPNLILDLNFLTQTPIKIKSEFIDTNASAQIQFTGPVNNPKIIGQIQIFGGKINFPYKPLFITQGHLYFPDTFPNQPTIDLTAKNNLKRHKVTMHLSGPISNSQISLAAYPSLSSEQIGALLLLGTENTSLNMIMPAIIMQNLNNIVFGSIDDEGKTSYLIKKLFKPLDHVKFVPSFSDETGRGGLKGAVEVDINDRLHALIQKNFSLTEDTKLEIDYAISDDVSIRAIKDERGDLGSELEIRFKI